MPRGANFMNNLLDEVLISPAVYQQWQRLAKSLVSKLPQPVNPQDFGDEDAEQLPNGSLRIFACYKDRRIAELTVPPDQWAWRFPKN